MVDAEEDRSALSRPRIILLPVRIANRSVAIYVLESSLEIFEKILHRLNEGVVVIYVR